MILYQIVSCLSIKQYHSVLYHIYFIGQFFILYSYIIILDDGSYVLLYCARVSKYNFTICSSTFVYYYIYTLYMICPHYLYGNPILIPWLSPMCKQTLKEINQPILLDTDHLPYYRSGKARIVVPRFWISLGWIWNNTISYTVTYTQHVSMNTLSTIQHTEQIHLRSCQKLILALNRMLLVAIAKLS